MSKMRVAGLRKRQADDVEKAEAIVRAHKEKEKKARAKTA